MKKMMTMTQQMIAVMKTKKIARRMKTMMMKMLMMKKILVANRAKMKMKIRVWKI